MPKTYTPCVEETCHDRTSRPPLSRRHVGKLLLAAPLRGAASRAWAQPRASQSVAIETRTLDELHKAALAEGGELLVYGGGDLPNGSAGTERAFNARFPGMKIRILVDRSKYHHVRIDNQLALGRLACDAAHILSINAYDRWKADGRLLPYKPAGWDQIYPDLKDPDARLHRLHGVRVQHGLQHRAGHAKRTRRATRSISSIRNSRTASRSSYPHDDDAMLYQFDRIVSEHGWGYIEKLLAQNVTWFRGSAPARIAVEKGEKAVTFTASGPLATPAERDGEVRAAEERQLPVLAAAIRDLQGRAASGGREALHQLARCRRRCRIAPGNGRCGATRRSAEGTGRSTAYNTYPAQFRLFLQDRVRLEKCAINSSN